MAKRTKHKTLSSLRNAVAEELQRMVRLKAAVAAGCEYINCVTCNSQDHWKNLQGGHFIPRTRTKHMLLEENIHPQCNQCNGFEHGNSIDYQFFMEDTYGRDFVKELNDTKFGGCDLRRPELEDLLFDYRARNRELEAQL